MEGLPVAETKISAKFSTSIPPPVRTALKLEAGDFVQWWVENNQITIKKKES